VLERCERIAELVQQGHTLSSAGFTLEQERMLRLMEEVEKSPRRPGERLLSKDIKLRDGKKIKLDAFIHAFIAKAIDSIGLPERKNFVALMRDSDVASTALQFIQAGYNPVCMFDGEQIEVVPDFIVSHWLSEKEPSKLAWLVVSLLRPIRQAFSALGLVLPDPVLARAAPKIWGYDGDTIVEYNIFLGGGLGFELLRETASTIGLVPKIEKAERNQDVRSKRKCGPSASHPEASQAIQPNPQRASS